VKAHHKKEKKAAKKNPLYRSKLKKDPGVPNLYPFREKLLAMVKEEHEKEQVGKARMRKEAQSLAQLASDAGGSLADFEKKQVGPVVSVDWFLTDRDRTSRSSKFKAI
jgi:nuclear GTP-binding protein